MRRCVAGIERHCALEVRQRLDHLGAAAAATNRLSGQHRTAGFRVGRLPDGRHRGRSVTRHDEGRGDGDRRHTGNAPQRDRGSGPRRIRRRPTRGAIRNGHGRRRGIRHPSPHVSRVERVVGTGEPHRTLEPVPTAALRRDAVLSQDLPNLHEALDERVVGDRDVAPDRLHQLLLRDQPTRVPDETGQHVERAGTKVLRDPPTPQLAPPQIERRVSEDVDRGEIARWPA